MMSKYFKGRKLVVATMHGKEEIIKPLFREVTGAEVMAPLSFNTDIFGTFSGEIKRAKDPLSVARDKCDAAASLTGADLVMASEGSFGAHPVMGFIPANEEILLLKDYKNGMEFTARVLSIETNFAGNSYYDACDVMFFATQAGFPAHAMIIRKNKNDNEEVYKGIYDAAYLKKQAQYFINKYGSVFVETDMRAHHNPTRRKVIRQAAEKLVGIIRSSCPVCEAPGFTCNEVIKGLPCSYCSSPTNTPKAYKYECRHCGFNEIRNEATTKQEDPAYCDQCNP